VKSTYIYVDIFLYGGRERDREGGEGQRGLPPTIPWKIGSVICYLSVQAIDI
jgi:hypothetical protein